MKGKFIVIEGIDGAGTTTQARLLSRWMNDNGLPTVQTCEPSTGPVGRLIREILQQKTRGMDPAALALLFAADRVDHIRNEIMPQLNRGTHVISDRYVFSSLAYQSLELDLFWVEMINGFAPLPDLAIYLRVPPELAAARRNRRGAPEEIFDAEALQQRIARKYDELFHVTSSPSPSGSTMDPNGKDPPRIPEDPLGSILDPPGSGVDPVSNPCSSSSDIANSSAFVPAGSSEKRAHPSHIEVIDGSLPIESINKILKQLVQKVASRTNS